MSHTLTHRAVLLGDPDSINSSQVKRKTLLQCSELLQLNSIFRVFCTIFVFCNMGNIDVNFRSYFSTYFNGNQKYGRSTVFVKFMHPSLPPFLLSSFFLHDWDRS